jgi:hypothetical protein
MLRIVTEQCGDACTISLHGRLAGEWVALLDHEWRCIVDSVPWAKVTAVLSEVSFINVDGEELLARMWRRGVEFVGSGCMNQYVIDKIQGKSAPAGKGKRRPRVPPHGDGTEDDTSSLVRRYVS